MHSGYPRCAKAPNVNEKSDPIIVKYRYSHCTHTRILTHQADIAPDIAYR